MRTTMVKPPPELPPMSNNNKEISRQHATTQNHKDNHKEISTTKNLKPGQSKSRELSIEGWKW
eukprot:15172072-Ditylum_brightwellii.AAC.1